MPYWQRKTALRRRRGTALPVLTLSFLLVIPTLLEAQNTDTDKPVPIFSGSAGAFSFVTAGQNLIDSQINPVLLVPLGDRWLVESRAAFEGQF